MSGIEMPDAVHQMLCERIETLESEIDALAEENEQIRAGVKTVRDYAGDHLPAVKGLVVVQMLEEIMRRAG